MIDKALQPETPLCCDYTLFCRWYFEEEDLCDCEWSGCAKCHEQLVAYANRVECHHD